MSPKEKAHELYAKYELVYIQNFKSKHEVILDSALIGVSEIEDTETLIHRGSPYLQLEKKHKEYWKEVRNELNKK